MVSRRFWSRRSMAELRKSVHYGIDIARVHYGDGDLPPLYSAVEYRVAMHEMERLNRREVRTTRTTPVRPSTPTEATLSRQTQQDTTTTPLEGPQMTKTNRQSALSCAVFSFPSDGELVSTMEILSRAERFTEWLDNEGTTRAEEPQRPREETPARDVVAEITALANGYREQWGNLAVETILSRVGELSGQEFEPAIRAAIEEIPNLGFGRHLTEAVVEALGALTRPDQPQAAGVTTEAVPQGNTGDRIVEVLTAAVRQYGAPAQRLLDTARVAQTGGALTAQQAVDYLMRSEERRTYPTQVDTLIEQIRSL